MLLDSLHGHCKVIKPQLNMSSSAKFIANGTDDAHTVINRFVFWVPCLISKDSLYDNFLPHFQRN